MVSYTEHSSATSSILPLRKLMKLNTHSSLLSFFTSFVLSLLHLTSHAVCLSLLS